ncbi:MAG: DUF6655 family protein [Planctomycetota bacterium]
MRVRLALLLALWLSVWLVAGCNGTIRDTTTARAAEETLIVSTSAERAVRAFAAEHLQGKKVWIDEQYFKSVDAPYVISCLREHVSEAGALLVDKEEEAELVLEVRCGTLGVNDPAWLFGIPSLPIGYSDIIVTLPQISIGYDPQYAWAKFQFWTYDARTGETVALGESWGKAQTGWFQSITPNAIATAEEAVASVESKS